MVRWGINDLRYLLNMAGSDLSLFVILSSAPREYYLSRIYKAGENRQGVLKGQWRREGTLANSNMACMAGSSSTKSSFTSASRVRYARPSTAHFLVRVSMLVLHSHLKETKLPSIFLGGKEKKPEGALG